jgi:hypothetical protein
VERIEGCGFAKVTSGIAPFDTWHKKTVPLLRMLNPYADVVSRLLNKISQIKK